MALQNRGGFSSGTGVAQGQGTGTNQAKSSAIVIDIKDKNLVAGEASVLDPTQKDIAFSFGALPPKGYYDLKMFLAKDGLTLHNNDSNGQFSHYAANLETKIVNSHEGDWDKITVFATVTTKIGRGKAISTMAAIFIKMGFKFKDNRVTPLSQVQHLAAGLKQEPIIKQNLIDWQGSYKKDDGSYENLFLTMEDFPQNEDGTFQSNCVVTLRDGSRKEIQARLRVVEWGDSKRELQAPLQTGVPVVNKQVVNGTPAPNLTPAATNVVAGTVAGTVSTNNVESEVGTRITGTDVASNVSEDDSEFDLQLGD